MNNFKRLAARLFIRFWIYSTSLYLIFKNNSELYYHLAKTVYVNYQDIVKAINVLEKGVNWNPYDLRLKGLLANMYVLNKNYDSALKIYYELLETDGINPQLHINTAGALMRKGDYNEAIKYLLSIKHLLDNLGNYYYIMGKSFMGLQDYESANNNLLKAIEMDPNDILFEKAYEELKLLIGK